ncbi:MAG: cytochrome c oxidase subunit II [Oligoflexia bacterium]|nr:cytochrome c oxidase subunit II [Oligoflexia bacterium]
MFRFLPEPASEFAPNIDWINNLITDLSVFFTVAIVGAMIYFAIRYRRRDGVDHATPRILGSHTLEAIWTVVPTLVCIFIAYWGIAYYRDMRTVPADAITIDVRGQKWKWDFEYSNGKKTTSELVVPVNKPIKLVISSRDVLHSFFLPSMRVKKDAVPGQYTYLWFRPIKEGVFQAFCTEYCGKDHSAMLAKLHVVSEAEFGRWLNDRSEEALMAKLGPAERGKALFQQKGCNACHSLDGSRLVGPSLMKLVGRTEKLSDGSEQVVDENYIKESILDPNKKVVATFPPNVMPAFAGQLSDEDVDGLIAFIRAQDGSAVAAAPKAEAAVNAANMTPAQKGEHIYRDAAYACFGCHSVDGSKVVGPTFKGVYGRQEKLTDGSSVTVDDAYIKNSILNPGAQIVEGFANMMPPFQGRLNDDDIKNIIEYLKTVK